MKREKSAISEQASPPARSESDNLCKRLADHNYDVVEMWKQDPQELLQYEGLLPLATLCRAQSGERLLAEVASRIKQIKSREQRRETLNLSRVLAGVRYDRDLIYRILKESDMLEESVVYQDILQKGVQIGRQEGSRRNPCVW